MHAILALVGHRRRVNHARTSRHGCDQGTLHSDNATADAHDPSTLTHHIEFGSACEPYLVHSASQIDLQIDLASRCFGPSQHCGCSHQKHGRCGDEDDVLNQLGEAVNPNFTSSRPSATCVSTTSATASAPVHRRSPSSPLPRCCTTAPTDQMWRVIPTHRLKVLRS